MKKKLSLRQQDYISGLLFVLPILIMMTIWFYYPALKSLIYSFQQVNFFKLNDPAYIGIDNFIELFQDAAFKQAVGNTIFITLTSIPVLLIGGFAIANLIEGMVYGNKGLFRTLFFIPAVTSSIALTMSLMYLFVRDGFIPLFLNKVLQIPNVTWAADPRTALGFVSILVMWKNLGIFVVLYINALKTIPSEIFEAAEMDGAKGLRKLLYITIPLVKPTTVLSLLLSVTWCMQTFDEPFTLARSGSVVGSPAGTTSTIITFFYSQNFRFFRPGYASSAAFVLFIALLLFSIGQNLIENRQKKGE